MSRLAGEVRVWGSIDWHWHLPHLGFRVGCNWKGGDCARWFRIEAQALFLWLSLHIDGREPELEEEQDQ